MTIYVWAMFVLNNVALLLSPSQAGKRRSEQYAFHSALGFIISLPMWGRLLGWW